MLLGIDPIIWKFASQWLGLGFEKLNQTIEDASMVHFSVIAIVVVVFGVLFLRTQKIR